MNLEQLSAYEIIEKRQIDDLNSLSYILRHKKSGARVALLSNDDNNKVFYIGFRTPPSDSSGVAHILEHSVLEGSEHFPVKDPFMELVKGSLNTFLNAMTYPDKTVYPVASCNDKDFANLMHVYLDAVFYPNIYKEPNIFYQEGWHYEMEKDDNQLTINGVVYNEMKGAFSSPDEVLEREIINSLYPDTSYANESGGDPEVIPQLAYEQFLDFHRTYYHPSNSYIFLYGNMDMAERLNWMDEAYLSHFDAMEVSSELAWQKPFDNPKYVEKFYSITDSEPLEDNTYYSYNISAGNVLDKEEYIAFQILDYALCSAPGAPLKKALLDAGIGKDVYSYFDNGCKQPYFSIVAKNADRQKREEFVSVIENELRRISTEGIDKKALRAGLNAQEFKYREADFGAYPAGLLYGLQVLDSWLHDDKKPFIHIEAGDTYQALREKVDSGYFEQLLSEKLLNNNHKSVVSLIPVRGLTEAKEKELAGKLAVIKASMSEEELKAVADRMEALRAFQEKEDTPEALATIPVLSREDISRKVEPLINDVRALDDTKVLFHKLFTNDIVYFRLMFNAGKVPAELFPYLGILKAAMGLVDTSKYTYGELFHEINQVCGGLVPVTNTFTDAKDLSLCTVTFELKGKTLKGSLKETMELAEEMLLHSDFTDEKRLSEILAELKSRMQSGLLSDGHTVAAGRALSYLTPTAKLQEQIGGLDFYRLVERLNAGGKEREELSEKIRELAHVLFVPENLMLDVACDKEEDYEAFLSLAAGLKERLYEKSISQKTPFKAVCERKNEGIMSSAQVQYVCKAGNFIEKGLPFTGALRILRGMLSNEYLWNAIRVKGGAYGCMCNFGKSGDCYFVSYRDPNLSKTLESYKGAVDFVKNFEGDERTMTQFIIGAISTMDTPLNASTKALRSLSAYMTNQTEEDFLKERMEVLEADADTIRSLALYVSALLEEDCVCVVGNETKLKEEKELFGELVNLFQS